jgi:hypothetical protein
MTPPPRDGIGRKKRRDKPARIPLGNGDEGLRNDLVAIEWGESERTVNRGDAQGAPYFYAGGVKYRPINEYRAYRASRIVRRGQAPRRPRISR